MYEEFKNQILICKNVVNPFIFSITRKRELLRNLKKVSDG